MSMDFRDSSSPVFLVAPSGEKALLSELTEVLATDDSGA